MRVLISVSLVLCLILSSTLGATLRFQSEWLQWKEQNGKRYSSKEVEEHHRQVWVRNFLLVESHNNRVDVSFSLELNEFADGARDSKPIKFETQSDNSVQGGAGTTSAPSSWDWRTKGAISGVKNQGQIGAVAAIATLEELESYSFITSGKMVSASIPEIIDCCTHGSSAGGLYYDTFNCVHNIGGICSAADYPKVQDSCKNTSCTPVVMVKGGAQVKTGNEIAMMESVYQMPVMAGIDASHTSFQLYRSGIYSEPKCSSTRLDHAVQVVGYGSQDGQDFWICKNSWGKSWGMDGYILLARNKKNMCGIATAAYYPV